MWRSEKYFCRHFGLSLKEEELIRLGIEGKEEKGKRHKAYKLF